MIEVGKKAYHPKFTARGGTITFAVYEYEVSIISKNKKDVVMATLKDSDGKVKRLPVDVLHNEHRSACNQYRETLNTLDSAIATYMDKSTIGDAIVLDLWGRDVPVRFSPECATDEAVEDSDEEKKFGCDCDPEECGTDNCNKQEGNK